MAKVSFKRGLYLLARIGCIGLALLSVIELISYGLYSHPPKREAWQRAAQEYYRAHESHSIQYDSNCAEFDPTVSYLLKPGPCEFENREFKTMVHVNSVGLRDDEGSLHSPEVIVLGGSFAMGWGVQQDESFPQLLEKRLGTKVLNAGIASFSTARESILLNRLDTSKLKVLIIQYNENDVVENNKFIKYDLNIKTIDKRSYLISRRRSNERLQPYRFGQYFSAFIPEVKKQADLWASEMPMDPKWIKKCDRQDYVEAKYFHRILSGCLVDLSTIPILVVELNNHGANDGGFIGHLEQRMLEENVSEEYKKLNMHPLDLSAVLSKNFYYTHDAHLVKEGHEKVAEVLSDYISTQKWLKQPVSRPEIMALQ